MDEMTVDERCVRVSAHDILGKDEEEQEPERTLGPSKDTVFYELMFVFDWDVIERKWRRAFKREKLPTEKQKQMTKDLEEDEPSPRRRMILTDYGPANFVARCRGAGLEVALSSDPTALYVRVGARLGFIEHSAEEFEFEKKISEERLMAIHESDKSGKDTHDQYDLPLDEDPKRLKQRLHHMTVYAPFKQDKAHIFAKSTLNPATIWGSGDRQQMITKMIQKDIKSGGAGILLDADTEKWGWRMGNPIALPDYEERSRLEHTWCSAWPFGKHKGYFWSNAPLHEIREYYGEEVSFYFAWLELYCVWLKFPAIMGILAFIIQFSYPSILVGYCGCIIIWSTAFLEFWKRRENELAFMWNCADADGVSNTRIRAEFLTHPDTEKEWRNPITGIIGPHFDEQERDRRTSIAHALTVVACASGVGINLGAIYLGQEMNTHLGGSNGQTLASVVLAVSVAVLTAVCGMDVLAAELEVISSSPMLWRVLVCEHCTQNCFPCCMQVCKVYGRQQTDALEC